MDERRKPILVVACVFTAALGVLTLYVLFREGPDVLTVFSLLVVAMFGFGIVGALRDPSGRGPD